VIGAELLKAGQLSAAVERVAGEVKAKPADAKMRTFYFELLCLTGDLDRAGKQLNVLAAPSVDCDLAVAIYRGAIHAEMERRSFFHGGQSPRVLVETPYLLSQLQAVERHAAGDFPAARISLQSAEELRGEVHGTLNGKAFSDLKDADDLLGPFLEICMEGRYTWIAWESIRTLGLPPPRHLRDLVWAPASIELHSGAHGEVLVFCLYVDSYLHADEEVKLGRRTDSKEDSKEFTIALGQKLVTTTEADYGILEVRTLEVDECPAHG